MIYQGIGLILIIMASTIWLPEYFNWLKGFSIEFCYYIPYVFAVCFMGQFRDEFLPFGYSGVYSQP